VRGLMNFHKKDNEAAARELEQYLEAHPEFAYAHYYAGMAYSAMRRPDKMLTHFEQFLRMKPDAPEARKVQAVMRATR
jgi:tetratricopeptide (TPR) repeat protein